MRPQSFWNPLNFRQLCSPILRPHCPMHLFLAVTLIEKKCLFKLSWHGGELEPCEISYSENLTDFYENWKNAYLHYYGSALRAKAEAGVGTMPTIDWRTELVNAEAALLAEFNLWLEHANLSRIRSTIFKFAISPPNSEGSHQQTQDSQSHYVDLFVTCYSSDASLDLTRLPWEAWEVGREFTATKTIRIVRKPTAIQATTVKRPRRDRLRVLAILGDDTGLDFKHEKDALQQFSPKAEVKFIGWQPNQAETDLKQLICNTIADPEGWDILFFAGHSNETKLTQGELAIAPGESILIKEIAPQLKIARERGLQFAIFNSCNGLSIANALIESGFGNVAVMREPIHNSVAQEFLVRFLQAMADYEDVHEAMNSACEHLKARTQLTYPSAHLIPSLFRHPDSVLFKLQPARWWSPLKKALPNRKQAIVLTALSLLSVISPVQQVLIESRQVVQSGYRYLTGQISSDDPSVLLVQIDQKSIGKLDSRKVYPIDRAYIAQLVKQIRILQPQVIGIDFVFDSPAPEDASLKHELEQAMQQNTKIVLAKEENGASTITPTIAPLDRISQGYVNAFPWYVELPKSNCTTSSCPFAFAITSPPKQPHLLPLTSFSQAFGQNWLQPIVDFSIPPDRAYQVVSADDLLAHSNLTSKSIVMIAPGDYDRAGLKGQGEDVFDPPPLPFSLWQPNSKFTGGEFHAYMVHHLLANRFVVPIPDLWMIAIAALFGKGIVLLLKDFQYSRRRLTAGLMGSTAVFGLVGLELYQSAAILIPWAFPSIVFWICVLPILRKKRHGN